MASKWESSQHLAGSWSPGRLEAVPSSPHQVAADTGADDHAEGAGEAGPSPYRSEVQAILDACTHLRDRLLFAVLYDSGVRIGEALGLRHEDIAVAEREITVVPRASDNGARSKSRLARTIPVSAELIRLYGDYLHAEYADLDSDYVFVNLFAEPRGHALSYPATSDLVVRLASRTGIDFDPHWCRHGFATRMLRDQVPVEVVSKLLGHASLSTTLSISAITPEAGRRSTRPRDGRVVHRSEVTLCEVAT